MGENADKSSQLKHHATRVNQHSPRDISAKSAGQAITMQAVGRLAGVSQVTVSRALSNPEKVSPKTLKKIQDAIEATGFVPNAVAGALASRRSKLISVLVPSITNIVYTTMIKAFTDSIAGSGYQILLSETGFEDGAEEALIATHLSRRPDAVMLTGIDHSARSRMMLLGANLPIVELWDLTDSPIDVCVGFSHAESGRAAARYAKELGFKSVATVFAGDERATRRGDAFIDEFESVEGNKVTPIIFSETGSLAKGRAGLCTLLDDKKFDGGFVFCSSDNLAHGVLIEAQSRGINVPNDLSIVGFGDQELSRAVEPKLTSVRVDRPALGKAAAKALLDQLEGREAGPRIIDIGFEIIKRGSTQARFK